MFIRIMIFGVFVFDRVVNVRDYICVCVCYSIVRILKGNRLSVI